MFGLLWSWWLALPVVAASLIALGVIWARVVRPVVQGVGTLIEYAEFLHAEVTSEDGSLRAQIVAIHAQLDIVSGQSSVTYTQLEAIAVQVEAMDEVWSKWVFSHAHEHAEIWRILALLGYDRRHHFTQEQDRPK